VSRDHLSWDVWWDVHQMLAFHFMVNALRAGTIVAVAAGVIGWFMVLRNQSFAGHTLALAGFPGASCAIWLGVSAQFGYFGFCIAAAAVIAVAGRTGVTGAYPEESALVGTVQAYLLAGGVLFVSLYKGFLNSVTGLLFGSILGVTDRQVVVLLAVAAGALAVLAVAGRPLFFASVDPYVAAAQGVPVRLLSGAFLILMGTAAAEVSQITGSLLVFALMVMPAAAARAVTTRPGTSLVLTVVIALGVTWVGFGLAYFSVYPVGFFVTSVGFVVYLVATMGRLRAERAAGRS